MCSIAGIILCGTEITEQIQVVPALERMMKALNHRGPDDNGLWIAPQSPSPSATVGLANTRLAILDLSPAGHQPMQDEETGSCLTYNGEIYNYRELRQELGSRRSWRSQTDTEVVLRAYDQWGVGSLEKLRGMFALALWDAAKQKLLLARDPLGIKPLYYYRTQNSFVFASEIRALLVSGFVPRRLSHEGLSSYLGYGSVEAPVTILEGVRSLLPGQYMIVKPAENSLDILEAPFAQKLWDGVAETETRTRADAVAQLREKLAESVRLHLLSDVPLGVFLSGGMDSSALVALMSQVAEEKPKTFSVVFAERKFTEAAHARLVAERFNTEHHEIPLSEEGLLKMLPMALQAIDQPTMDGINTYVVSKAVKEAGITVALSGLGGDELFAGYTTFRRALRLQEIKRFSARWRRMASAVGRSLMGSSVQQKKFWQLVTSDGSPRAAYAITRQLFAPEDVRRLFSEYAPASQSSNSNGYADPVNAVSVYELRGYMANTLLRDTDMMSMAHSLEVRVPFVDPVIVKHLLALPGAWKLSGRGPKPLLQDIVKDLLPPHFLRRPKMGFTLPFENWMRSRLRHDLNDLFADEGRLLKLGINPHVIQNTWQQFLRHPRRIGWARLWSLFVLTNWCELHSIYL
jgi:asparagine synthase (glutamine-hydrolysing)